MRDMLRIAAQGLLAGTLLVMLYHAPGPVLRELQFVVTILVVTLMTRSMSTGSGVNAFALGLGVVVLLAIGAGQLMASAGLDMSAGITNWGLVPLVEEAVKLLPVVFAMAMYQRQKGLTPNPSDLLMLGCCAGAGFALSENVALVQNNAAVARDMARQYGPNLAGFYLVPGAWGAAGYAGHAAATGFIAGSYGLGRALEHRLGARWWIVPAACTAWIVIEHMFVNLYVNAGSSIALIFGNGRLTPWLFVALAVLIVTLDVMRHQSTLAQSRMLRWTTKLTKTAMLATKPPLPPSRFAAVRMYVAALRTVNAAGWYAHANPPAAGPRAPRPQKLETV
jgi:RsiW-degrading membrane proteinase PrsW (M82 family)